MVERRGDFTLASVQAGGMTRQSSRAYDDSRAEGTTWLLAQLRRLRQARGREALQAQHQPQHLNECDSEESEELTASIAAVGRRGEARGRDVRPDSPGPGATSVLSTRRTAAEIAYSDQPEHSFQQGRAPQAAAPSRSFGPTEVPGRPLPPVVERTSRDRAMNPPGPVLVLDSPGIGARPGPVHAREAGRRRRVPGLPSGTASTRFHSSMP